jgi:1-acyl-sn-glycerol-3-phosphate acyltransferase
MKLSLTKGSQILLTGVTGFVGKVVLEELLRRRDDLNLGTVYVLIREKGDATSPDDRFMKEVASSPCFSELPSNWTRHVKVVSGDLTRDELALQEATIVGLKERVTHIINCAASVEFDLPIAAAAAANITSALNVLEFARTCERLQSLVSVSTAYVTPHPGVGVPVEEELVDLPFDPEVVYQSILDGTADEDALMAETRHPNTYTFTKCLSEQLLHRRMGDVPLAIVRPSIISASWQYPRPGWIDSHAAFAGFVALIGAGLLKAIVADDSTVLDIVPCDEVADRVINTTFWSEEKGERPFIQHSVSGIDKGCRIDTCLAGIESYFQRNPVERWPNKTIVSNGRGHGFQNWRKHTAPTKLAGAWFTVSGQEKKKRQVKKLMDRIQYLNEAFPYFTHNSFSFVSRTPLNVEHFEPKQYIETVCRGVYQNLMRRNEAETMLGGSKHKPPKKDLKWARQQPDGNWAIRSSAYMVKKGFRKCTDRITFDRPSFERATSKIDPNGLVVVVPNHRSYMDFVVCSYLFFSQPELNVPIPHIAAASEFSKIPVLGWLFQQTHAFYIERGKGKEDPQLTEKIQGLVDQNQTLEFFVEGTRSRSRKFLKPKRGLLRALQNTGIPCTVLPISISYDLVPEEGAFLKELKGGPKPKMKLGALMKWTTALAAGKVDVGRVHIECGEAIRVDETEDIYQVSNAIVGELQDKTAASSFHLNAFLHHHPIPGVDLDWLKEAINARGGRIMESPLKDVESVDPLNERTMRYHWMHHFYPDVLRLMPNNPALARHITENAYAPGTGVASKTDPTKDARLCALLRVLFGPIVEDYTRVLDTLARENGLPDMPDAKAVVRAHPESFLPIVEEMLADLKERGLIVLNEEETAFLPGRNWLDLNALINACQWREGKERAFKSA